MVYFLFRSYPGSKLLVFKRFLHFQNHEIYYKFCKQSCSWDEN